jgi:hypothetical protein
LMCMWCKSVDVCVVCVYGVRVVYV